MSLADPIELDAELVLRASEMASDVVVLPSRVGSDRAVYSERSVTLVKELRALGVEAAYLDPPERREFEVKKGALSDAIQTIALGVASAASWDALKVLLLRKPTRRLSVTYLELEDHHGQKGTAWKVEGDSAAVVDVIDKLRGGTTRGSAGE